jgi:hypothetical protein
LQPLSARFDSACVLQGSVGWQARSERREVSAVWPARADESSACPMPVSWARSDNGSTSGLQPESGSSTLPASTMPWRLRSGRGTVGTREGDTSSPGAPVRRPAEGCRRCPPKAVAVARLHPGRPRAGTTRRRRWASERAPQSATTRTSRSRDSPALVLCCDVVQRQDT